MTFALFLLADPLPLPLKSEFPLTLAHRGFTLELLEIDADHDEDGAERRRSKHH